MSELIVPNQRAVEKTIKSIFELLFPTTHSFTETEIECNRSDLQKQITEVLSVLTDKNDEITQLLFKNLENIKKTLLKDANYILESDPAATHQIEVISIYPGFFAIFCYRLANFLAKLSLPLFPRMITEYAHRVTGIDIHPLATIGVPFAIDHGTGIVIGETANIGNNVKLYQGVTLGAKSFSLDADGNPIKNIARHPIVEDDVIIYSGATVLGRITIGKGAEIGGNMWITEPVPAGSKIMHSSPRL